MLYLYNSCFCSILTWLQCFDGIVSLLGHINNLYNTCFWKLVHSGLTTADAEKRLYVRVAVYVQCAPVYMAMSKHTCVVKRKC